MKKICVLTLLAILCTFSLSAQSHSKKDNKFFHHSPATSRSSVVFTYILTTLSEPYNNLTGATSINNNEVWDEPTYTFPIGFPFELNGNEISSLQFFASGSMMMAPTMDPDISALLFPFETDLVDRGAISGTSMSPISYKVEGSPGSRIQKVEFKNAGSYYEMADNNTLDMFINFQFWLYEGSNRIEFRFGPSSIPDPDLFYGGAPGAYSGLSDYDIPNDVSINSNFISGDADDPYLIDATDPLIGTPPNEIVYRLSLNAPLTVVVTGEDGTSACNPNGSATAIAAGGVEPYSYLWNNGETTSTILNLDAGTYTVTVTDDNGTTASGSVTITNLPPVNANAFATDETGVDANDGTATSAAFGGSPPYTYLWSNSETSQMITDLAPGVYTVTVTDSDDCTDSQTVTVNAFGCPELLLEAAVSHVNCFGICDGSIEIAAVINGTPPFAYLWSNGNTTALVDNLCAGFYQVTVTDSDGCNVSEEYEITQPPALVVNAGSTNETMENGNDGTAWAAPTGGTPPYSYLWSNGEVGSMIIGLSPGNYTVTVTDANSCTASETVTVDSFSCLLTALIVNSTCFGICNGSIEATLVNAVPPVAYIWSNGGTTSLITNLCAGSYDVTASDANGCVATGTYTITQPAPLSANAGSTDETAPNANDGTAWASPAGGTPPYDYLWSFGLTDSLLTNLPPGLYDVTITDEAGCTDVETVVVHEFPCAFNVVIGTEFTSCFGLCDGSIIALVGGGIGPYTFDWNTGDTTDIITNLCEGFYDVTITDEGQNCSTVEFAYIFQPAPLDVTIEEVVHITDSTTSSITIGLDGGTPPYSYVWSGPNGFSSTDEDLSDIDAGYYSVLISDANGCVITIDSIEIRDETVSTTNPSQLDVNVFPNPANEDVFIDIGDIQEYFIKLYNLDGRMLREWKNENSISVRPFAQGVYVIKINSGDRFALRRLVITR